jgi:hypothetical protein
LHGRREESRIFAASQFRKWPLAILLEKAANAWRLSLYPFPCLLAWFRVQI